MTTTWTCATSTTGRSGPSSCRARSGRTGARRGPTGGPFRPTARACPCCWRPPTRPWGERAACCSWPWWPRRRRSSADAWLSSSRGTRRPPWRPGSRRPGRLSSSTRSTSTRRRRRRSRRAARWPCCSERRAPAGAALAALCAAALPWLHVKMIPAAAALGLVALVRLRGRALAAFLAVAGAAAVSFGLYYASVFGLASPLALYGGVPADARVLLLALAAGALPRPLLRPAADRARLPARARRAAGRRCAGARPGPMRSSDWPCSRLSCRGACGGEASARRRGSWCRCCRSWPSRWRCGSRARGRDSRAGARACS